MNTWEGGGRRVRQKIKTNCLAALESLSQTPRELGDTQDPSVLSLFGPKWPGLYTLA